MTIYYVFFCFKFAFSDKHGYGNCTDVIGHEFTHCVTDRAMILNIYENDFGAINEGMSDVMGNLIEMMLEHSHEREWLISKKHINGAMRSIKDPHQYGQPEYVWDINYVPATPTPNDYNDME